MELWLMLLIAIIIISLLLLFSKIYIDIKYKRNGKNDYIKVDVSMLKRLLVYQMEVPIVEVDDNKSPFLIQSVLKTANDSDEVYKKKEKRLIDKMAKLYSKRPSKLRHAIHQINYFTHLYSKAIDKILRLIVCEKFYWKTVYGAEDAALTGIMAGLLWTGQTVLITQFKRRITLLGKPVIMLHPIFGCNQCEVDFQCIFSIRLGNVIKAIRSIYAIKNEKEK